MKRVRGLTLIEALVAISIVAVLLGAGVPSLRAMHARRSAEAAAALFMADMQFARAEALKRGHSVTICRSISGTACATDLGSWHQGWVVFPSPGAADAVGSAGLLRVQRALPGITSFQSVSGAANTDRYIRFNARGIAPGAAASLVVASDAAVRGGARLLCVAITGRVSLRPEGEVACPS